jgi:hypothetical protein
MSKALYPLAILCMLLCVVGCKKDFEENKVPVADAGQSKTITLPDSAVVSGSGTDADGKVVAYLWSQVSGPANSTIVNPGATSTIIRFTVPGSYLFQLMVTDDNGATGVDTVSVLVTGSKIEGNKVPIANAGPSKTITLPDSAVVTGTGTDADGKVVAYLWSQVSGPASSTIVNPGSPSTSFQFSVAGSYIFQLLVVDDKGATGVDTMTVLVKPAVGPQTLTLQPAKNPNEYNLILENGVNLSSPPVKDLPVAAWTRNNLSFTVRCLLKFDLSSIPSNATIVSANLYLYSYPSPTENGNLTDANFGTNNSMFVQQVTANWSPGTTTWFNQPATTTTNQISLATTSQSVLDLNLDVTAMVSSMVSGNANYGFLMKLQNESVYNSRIFVSSNNTIHTTKFPKLVVVYK